MAAVQLAGPVCGVVPSRRAGAGKHSHCAVFDILVYAPVVSRIAILSGFFVWITKTPGPYSNCSASILLGLWPGSALAVLGRIHFA